MNYECKDCQRWFNEDSGVWEDDGELGRMLCPYCGSEDVKPTREEE
jgi:DNA-directed RNA polymerase subunit RPC12/RpoP